MKSHVTETVANKCVSKKGAENNDSMQSQSKRTQVQGKG